MLKYTLVPSFSGRQRCADPLHRRARRHAGRLKQKRKQDNISMNFDWRPFLVWIHLMRHNTTSIPFKSFQLIHFFIAFHFISLHIIALLCIPLHSFAFLCIDCISLHCIEFHWIGTFSKYFSLHCLALPIDSCQVWEALAAAHVVVMALSHSEIPSAPLCVAFQGPRLVRVKSKPILGPLQIFGTNSRVWRQRLEVGWFVVHLCSFIVENPVFPSQKRQGLRSSRVSGRPGGMALIRKWRGTNWWVVTFFSGFAKQTNGFWRYPGCRLDHKFQFRPGSKRFFFDFFGSDL